jgi:hypothetical protein
MAAAPAKCHLCGSPIMVETRPRTVVIDCPTHGHFLVARLLWERLPKMTPVQRARAFFQLEGQGKRRVLRMTG